MSRSPDNLADGTYLVYPRIGPPLEKTVKLTVLQTTTGGGTMLEGGVIDAPIDLDTTFSECEIREGDIIGIYAQMIYSYACEECNNVANCPWTGSEKRRNT